MSTVLVSLILLLTVLLDISKTHWALALSATPLAKPASGLFPTTVSPASTEPLLELESVFKTAILATTTTTVP